MKSILLRIIPVLFCVLMVRGANADRPNILFLAVDDLRPEFGAYGADYIKSPNLPVGFG